MAVSYTHLVQGFYLSIQGADVGGLHLHDESIVAVDDGSAQDVYKRQPSRRRPRYRWRTPLEPVTRSRQPSPLQAYGEVFATVPPASVPASHLPRCV